MSPNSNLNPKHLREVNNVPIASFNEKINWIAPLPTIQEYRQMFQLELKPGLVMLSGIMNQKYHLKNVDNIDPYDLKSYLQLTPEDAGAELNKEYRTHGFKIVDINYPTLPEGAMNPPYITGLVAGDRVLAQLNENDTLGESIFNTTHSEHICVEYMGRVDKRGYVYHVLIAYLDQIYAKLK